MKGFNSLLSPSENSQRPRSQLFRAPGHIQINTVITRTFSASTILAIGALLQGLLVLLVPRYWILLPTAIVLFLRFADTLAITFRFRTNPYLEGSHDKKWAVVIPDQDGNMADSPADEKVAVLQLALKINHPMGLFAPNVSKVNAFTQRMLKELDDQAPSNGFLGQSEWHSVDERGANEIMLLSYWRSIDDVHKYSQSPTHLETWKWWDQTVHKDSNALRHVGISHEVFEAPRSRWEAVAVNFQPTRLGATTYLRKGDKLIGGTVEDAWISPIVEAKGRLRTSHGRLNWASNAGN